MVSYARMTKLAPQILFALLLLLSQTALVSHDVEHLGNAHSELCAVYVSQDQSADGPAICSETTTHSFQQCLAIGINHIVEPALNSAYASRAPPNTVFSS